VMQKELRAVVHGRVQMVMYRDFTRRGAKKLGLVGTVENLSNGTVEVLAQGEEAKLQKLLVRMRRGSLLSKVHHIDVEWRESSKQYSDFKIVL